MYEKRYESNELSKYREKHPEIVKQSEEDFYKKKDNKEMHK